MIGGRAVPLMWAWDVAVLANKARRIPVVDRTLRKGAGAAVRGAGTVVRSPRWTAASEPPRPSPRGSVRASSNGTRPTPIGTPDRPSADRAADPVLESAP